MLLWRQQEDSAPRTETFGNGQGLWEVKVPSRFHDRHLDKFAAYLQEHYHDILIVI